MRRAARTFDALLSILLAAVRTTLASTPAMSHASTKVVLFSVSQSRARDRMAGTSRSEHRASVHHLFLTAYGDGVSSRSASRKAWMITDSQRRRMLLSSTVSCGSTVIVGAPSGVLSTSPKDGTHCEVRDILDILDTYTTGTGAGVKVAVSLVASIRLRMPFWLNFQVSMQAAEYRVIPLSKAYALLICKCSIC